MWYCGESFSTFYCPDILEVGIGGSRRIGRRSITTAPDVSIGVSLEEHLLPHTVSYFFWAFDRKDLLSHRDLVFFVFVFLHVIPLSELP